MVKKGGHKKWTQKVEKVSFSVESQGTNSPKLSQSEIDVLHLLTNEFLTPKQVSIRRQTGRSATYKIIKKLKKKGLISLSQKSGHKIRGTLDPSTKDLKAFRLKNEVRLHGQEFNVRILFRDQRYDVLRKNSNLVNVDGNTVRLFRDSLEVYSGKSFYADTVHKATVRSFDYWDRIFARLENDFKIIIIKSRYQNVRLVNQHYSEINNEFAEECEKKAEKIRIYTNEDGKLWFTVDNSFNLHEAETQHPDTAQQDMSDVVRPFFNDLRDNKPPSLSQVMAVLDKIVLSNEKAAEINKETAAGLNSVVKLMRPADKEEVKVGPLPEYIG